MMPPRSSEDKSNPNMRIRLRLSISRDGEDAGAAGAAALDERNKRRKTEPFPTAIVPGSRRADDPPPLLMRAGWESNRSLLSRLGMPQPRNEAEAILFRTPPSFHKGGRQHQHSPRRVTNPGLESPEKTPTAGRHALSPPATLLVKDDVAVEGEGEAEEEEEGDFHKIMLLDAALFRAESSQREQQRKVLEEERQDESAVKEEPEEQDGESAAHSAYASAATSSRPSRRNSIAHADSERNEAAEHSSGEGSASGGSRHSDNGEGERHAGEDDDTPATTPRTAQSAPEDAGAADEELQAKEAPAAEEAQTDKDAEMEDEPPMLAQRDRVFAHALPLVRQRTDQHAGEVTLSLPYEAIQTDVKDVIADDDRAGYESSPRIVARALPGEGGATLSRIAMRRVMSSSSNASTVLPSNEEQLHRTILRSALPHQQIHHVRHPQDEILLASPSDALRAKLVLAGEEEVDDIALDPEEPEEHDEEEGPGSPWPIDSPLAGSGSQSGDEELDNTPDVFELAGNTALSQLDLVWADDRQETEVSREEVEDDFGDDASVEDEQGDEERSVTGSEASTPELTEEGSAEGEEEDANSYIEPQGHEMEEEEEAAVAHDDHQHHYYDDDDEEEEEDYVELLGRPRMRSSPVVPTSVSTSAFHSNSLTPQSHSPAPREEPQKVVSPVRAPLLVAPTTLKNGSAHHLEPPQHSQQQNGIATAAKAKGAMSNGAAAVRTTRSPRIAAAKVPVPAPASYGHAKPSSSAARSTRTESVTVVDSDSEEEEGDEEEEQQTPTTRSQQPRAIAKSMAPRHSNGSAAATAGTTRAAAKQAQAARRSTRASAGGSGYR